MKRWPIIPTLVVALAVAAMIALGLWQLLDRLPQKEAFLAQLAQNPAKPAMTFPRVPDDTLLFRKSGLFCLQPLNPQVVGAGASGYRMIVECRTGAEGPGAKVQLGTTRDPNAKLTWKGGQINGFLSHAPDSRSMIEAQFNRAPQQLMLVAANPPQGLSPNGRPDLSSVPNNHLAYAVQWFLFAAIAAIIYVLALRYRGKRAEVAPPPSDR